MPDTGLIIGSVALVVAIGTFASLFTVIEVQNNVTKVDSGEGLTGGPITKEGILSLTDTGVVPGTYGGLTVDSNGRITEASDETGVTNITTSNGISGGPITSTGDIKLDIDSLTEEVTIDGLDMIALYDVSNQTTRKMTRDNLLSGIAGGTVTEVKTGDGISGGPITVTGTLSMDIVGLTTESTVASNDQIAIWDQSESVLRKMTRDDFVAGINGTVTAVGSGIGLTGGPITGSGTLDVDIVNLTEETVVQGVDQVMIHDTSLGGIRRMSRTNFLSGVNGTVTQINSGLGLIGGPITGSGTLDVDINGLVDEPTIASGDEVMIYDVSNTTIRKITRANFLAGADGSVTSVGSGDGLTGGPITGSGTLSLDIDGLTVSGGISSGDELAVYDVSSGALRKITRANFLTGINGTVTQVNSGDGIIGGPITGSGTLSLDINGLAVETTIASNDEVAIYDTSLGSLRKMTRANFLSGVNGTVTQVNSGDGILGGPITGSGTLSLDINGLTISGGIASGDEVAVYDVSSGALRKITRANFLTGVDGTITDITAGTGLSTAGANPITTSGTINLDVNSMTPETTADDADEIAIYDDTAGAMRKMTRANFLAGSGGGGGCSSETFNIVLVSTTLSLADNTVYGQYVCVGANTYNSINFLMGNADWTPGGMDIRVAVYDRIFPTASSTLVAQAVVTGVGTTLQQNRWQNQTFDSGLVIPTTNTYFVCILIQLTSGSPPGIQGANSSANNNQVAFNRTSMTGAFTDPLGGTINTQSQIPYFALLP